MKDNVRKGTILIAEGTPLPATVRFESESFSAGWRLVKNRDGYGLGQHIRASGWSFFQLPKAVQVSAFGLDGGSVLQRAVNKVAVRVAASKLNCMEIAAVTGRQFLGFRYVTVSAHARHIQQSTQLQRANRKV